MEQIAGKSYQNRAFKLLSLATNGLFLFHLSFSLTLNFFIFSKQEPPHYYYKLLELLLTKSYMIVYCATDLGLFILLKYKQGKNLIQGTDYWLAAMLGIKYFFIVIILLLLFLFCCLFRQPIVF